jgi:hypothetical protein
MSKRRKSQTLKRIRESLAENNWTFGAEQSPDTSRFVEKIEAILETLVEQTNKRAKDLNDEYMEAVFICGAMAMLSYIDHNSEVIDLPIIKEDLPEVTKDEMTLARYELCEQIATQFYKAHGIDPFLSPYGIDSFEADSIRMIITKVIAESKKKK